MRHLEKSPQGLLFEGLPLVSLAEKYGTPLYVYSWATMEHNCRAFDEAFNGTDHLLFSSVAGLLKCARRAWLPLVFLLCSCGQTGDLYLPASDSKQGEIQKTKAEISVSDAAS